MAERKPLVRVDGELRQLPDGDTIEGAGIALVDGGSLTDTYVSAPFSVDGGGFDE